MASACRFARLAEADLEEILLYIATDNLRPALSFVAELRAHCERLALQPEAYPLREEYGEGVRLTVHGRYLIFHTVRAEIIVIERIIHAARHRDGLTI